MQNQCYLYCLCTENTAVQLQNDWRASDLDRIQYSWSSCWRALSPSSNPFFHTASTGTRILAVYLLSSLILGSINLANYCLRLMQVYSRLSSCWHPFHVVYIPLYLQTHHVYIRCNLFMVSVHVRYVLVITVESVSNYALNKAWSTEPVHAVEPSKRPLQSNELFIGCINRKPALMP